MPGSSVADKLRIKPGQQVLIMNAPDGFIQALGLPAGTRLHTSADGTFDFVLLFAHSKAEVDNEGKKAIHSLKPGGMLWIAYPKKSSKIKTDITRDVGWDSIRNAGMEGVSLIAIDDTWSAMRFRPSSEVKSSKKS